MKNRAYCVAVLHFFALISIAVGIHILAYIKWHYFPQTIAGLLVLTASWIPWGCPLTRWENHYRRRMNPPVPYPGSCTTFYINKFSGMQLPEGTILAAMLTNLAIASQVYWFK